MSLRRRGPHQFGVRRRPVDPDLLRWRDHVTALGLRPPCGNGRTDTKEKIIMAATKKSGSAKATKNLPPKKTQAVKGGVGRTTNPSND
jgi:hypothetical protein